VEYNLNLYWVEIAFFWSFDILVMFDLDVQLDMLIH
jgi:hypothetical protein